MGVEASTHSQFPIPPTKEVFENEFSSLHPVSDVEFAAAT